jgi:hypothetical protein
MAAESRCAIAAAMSRFNRAWLSASVEPESLAEGDRHAAIDSATAIRPMQNVCGKS